MEEIQNKWMMGPYTERQVDEKFPQGWVPLRRFIVKQWDHEKHTTKLRAADNSKR